MILINVKQVLINELKVDPLNKDRIWVCLGLNGKLTSFLLPIKTGICRVGAGSSPLKSQFDPNFLPLTHSLTSVSSPLSYSNIVFSYIIIKAPIHTIISMCSLIGVFFNGIRSEQAFHNFLKFSKNGKLHFDPAKSCKIYFRKLG